MISATKLANSGIGRSAALVLGVQPPVNPLKDLRQNELYMKPVPSKQDLKPFIEPVKPRTDYNKIYGDLGTSLLAYNLYKR